MGTFTKIKSLPLSIFNNAEYLSYLSSVLALLPSGSEDIENKSRKSLSIDVKENGSPELGITPEMVKTMENDLQLLTDVVNESRISQETEQALVHENNRDQLTIYITTLISRSSTLPFEAESDAGKFLYKVIKPYIGITRLPMAQKTAVIQGMLVDLRKEENMPYVETLKLEAYLSELEKENNSYAGITSQRIQTRVTDKKESGRSIRNRLGGQYDDMIMLAQSYSIVMPSKNASAFIKNLNQLISETTTAYNQRKKAPRTKKETNTGSGS